MQRNHLKLLSLLAVTALCLCSVAVIMEDSNEVDAITDLGTFNSVTGSDTKNNSNNNAAYSKLWVDITTLSKQGYFRVLVGSDVWITHGENDSGPATVTSGFGLTVNSGEYSDISGTISKAGSVEITYYNNTGGGPYTVGIVGVQGSTPVSSISIDGDSEVAVGDNISLSASVSPSNATDKSVTWSVTSGSSYVTISSSGTSCTVTGKAAGTATIKCAANDGSGKYATKTITVVKLVTSLNISTGSAGETIRLTATTSSGASDRSVQWEITSGSSIASLTNINSTSTGGYCTVTPLGYGTIVVTCTSTDGAKTADKTLYIGKVVFNNNGGSGGPGTMYCVNTSTSCFVDPNAEPSRSGYEFMGWATSSSGSVYYEPGDTVYGTSKSTKTFYAVWGKYGYLQFSANLGSGGPSTQELLIQSGSSDSITIPTGSDPTRSGYNFNGWSTSQTATSKQYSSGDSVTVSSGETVQLYAVWTVASKDIILSFNANGGSGAPSPITKTTTASSETFTIPSGTPTKSGYQFKGWSESSSATSASYVAGNTLTLSSDKTLYAVWSQIITITSTPSEKGVVGETYSYAVSTNVSGATISVSGASWLSVSGSTISGKPTASGTYDITVTVTKANCVTTTQNFTITVYSSLGFNSAPSASGIFAYVK